MSGKGGSATRAPTGQGGLGQTGKSDRTRWLLFNWRRAFGAGTRGFNARIYFAIFAKLRPAACFAAVSGFDLYWQRADRRILVRQSGRPGRPWHIAGADNSF